MPHRLGSRNSVETRGENATIQARDLAQSRLLVTVMGALLATGALYVVMLCWNTEQTQVSLIRSAIFSLTFAVVAWVLRSATPAAALWGGIICLLLATLRGAPGDSLAHSGLSPLLLLFMLTFLATRLGRSRKQALGLAEPAQGRKAAQVIANLSAAGVIAAISAASQLPSSNCTTAFPWTLLLLAALAEATADTLSSEIGQAFGGAPWLITRFKPVATGTDGAVTLVGTAAGLGGASAIALCGYLALHLTARSSVLAFLAAAAGLFFDSFLGATLERRGWLGNDLVNFTSTIFAVAVALALWKIQRLAGL